MSDVFLTMFSTGRLTDTRLTYFGIKHTIIEN